MLWILTTVLPTCLLSIGFQFNTNKVVQALVDSLPNVCWSKEFGMYYIPNNKTLELIFKTRGVAWVNGNYFFAERLINKDNPEVNLEKIRNRPAKKGFKNCPEEYLLT